MSEEEKRKAIPAEIRRTVLVEAGHRCSIPTCRQMVGVELHHITPWAKCHEHKADNLIALCSTCHARVHEGKIDEVSLRMYKANLQKLHDVYTQLEVDVLFEAFHKGSVPFANYLLIFVKRLLDSELIVSKNPGVYIMSGGVNASPCHLALTDKGREYVKALIQADELPDP